jgi:exodeoxyribonuclease VII large subunit
MAENALASVATAEPRAPGEPAGPVGVPGYPGPFPVGRYAIQLQKRLREMARVCIVGEVCGVRIGRGPNVYFELRDADGAIPCAMWRDDFDRSGLRETDLCDGAQFVAAGGCDYYPGSGSASPSFSFRVQQLRPAGEGDLLARLERLRRQLASEGLFDHQKRLAIQRLPRRIGVVTAEGSAARRDFLAGLERRSWRGTIVWGYAPVQDRRAAPAIAAQIRELAAVGQVDAIVVTRGGGSIADLWAFCDEALCRTVALLPVPVISAVGHDVDRTLIDDVAAVSCSTPTHAAEAAVALDCALASQSLLAAAKRIDRAGRMAVLRRARELAVYSRAPRHHLDRHRTQLHQKTRELRAASKRGLDGRLQWQQRIAGVVLERKLATARAATERERAALPHKVAALERAAKALAQRQEQALKAHRTALNAHDPQRTLERGYALITADGGDPLMGIEALRAARDFDIRMADGTVPARVADTPGASRLRAATPAGRAPTQPDLLEERNADDVDDN